MDHILILIKTREKQTTYLILQKKILNIANNFRFKDGCALF